MSLTTRRLESERATSDKRLFEIAEEMRAANEEFKQWIEEFRERNMSVTEKMSQGTSSPVKREI
jgi:hypothetical protein